MRQNPGPSVVSEHGDDPYTIAVDGRHIASVKTQAAETSDNARLIAAAPELLRGCQAALAYLVDPPSKFEENREEAARIIIEAIRKAKGE